MENQLPGEAEDATPMKFNEEIQYYLYETAKWAKFISIVGFVIVGLTVLMGLIAGLTFSSMSRLSPGFAALPGGGMMITIFYILMAVLYFFPTFYLYRFSSYVKQGINNVSELKLTEAFANLKSLYKFWGIITVVMIILYALIFILLIFTGLTFMNAMSRS